MALPTHCITLEEHAILPSLGDERDFYTEIWKTFPAVRQALRDFGAQRLADMDAGHVSTQIVSALPGMSSVGGPAGCRGANDELAAAVAASAASASAASASAAGPNPGRFRGFAALPMQEPAAAAAELERAVTELGLVGAMVDNADANGRHYDAEEYWVVFEAAERLDVPLYLHPAPPSQATMEQRFHGNYPPQVALGLATGANGWHADVALHVLKLYAAGVFQHFPKLKIIIGHNGEMLPIWIDRLDQLNFFTKAGLPKFSEAWNNNIWVTTSGLFSVPVFSMLLKTTKIERLMYSVDSPFEHSSRGWKFLEELADSKILTPDEMKMLAYGNAQTLLKL